VDFAQIEAFLVLCDELHFGRSAERLHVSQPRISRLIAGLENTVGGTLFDRTSRRVTPTPLGARLRDELAPAYQQLTTALDTARTAARSPDGLLRLGFAATTAVSAVDELVTDFQRAQPGCTVSLHEVPLADSYTPLRSGEIDVLVCWLVVDEPDLTRGPTIAEYPRVLAVGDDHPLARKRTVSAEVLGDYPIPNWAYQGTADRVRQMMVPSHTPSGRAVRIHPTEVRTVGETASLIARGEVVAPTVTSMRHRFGNERIVLVPIHDLPAIPLGLIWCTSHENGRIRALARVAQRAAA
jgi:DNA-binding transcriptional LysR family regulator